MKLGEAWNLAWTLSWTTLFSLIVPLLGGIWLDKQLGTTPLFILLGALLGILAATVGVARMAIRTFAATVPEKPNPEPELDDEEEAE